MHHDNMNGDRHVATWRASVAADARWRLRCRTVNWKRFNSVVLDARHESDVEPIAADRLPILSRDTRALRCQP